MSSGTIINPSHHHVNVHPIRHGLALARLVRRAIDQAEASTEPEIATIYQGLAADIEELARGARLAHSGLRR